jgi:hypothetical protein
MTVSASARTVDCGEWPASVDRERLVRGETRRLRRNHRILRVVSGYAWVTADGSDVILASSEAVLLPRGKHPAVVSALGDRPLVYEIQQDPC